MTAIISLLAVVICSLICVRVGTTALVLTGLSDQLARFQARSAFTTAGYTTQESERVMSHPVRRRIIGLLMLAGNVGLVTVVGSVTAAFVGSGGREESALLRAGTLAGGLALLWFLSTSKWIDHQLSRVIGWALTKYTDLDVRDYEAVLHMTGGYIVGELHVNEGDWLAGRTLIELSLSKEGVLILGIERPGGIYIGAPQGHTRLEGGDTLLAYGLAETLASLDQRRSGREGNREHEELVTLQRQIEDVERQVTTAANREDEVEQTVEIAVAELERLRAISSDS